MLVLHERLIIQERDFPGGPVVRSLPSNAGDMGLIPGLGRFHMPQNSETRAPQTL